MVLNREELIDLLETKTEQFNNPNFIESDPIQLPHRFTKKEDIEIIGFIISTLAWGNRKSIIKSGENLLKIMNHQPHEFVMNYVEEDFKFVHRTFNSADLNSFFLSLHRLYTKENGLEGAFTDQHTISQLERITQFREHFIKEPFLDRTTKHIANPAKGSSAKRINMYLRWMVRNDKKGVDFGIWKNVPMSDLHLPLDVHTGNVARKLGLLSRTQNDWKSVDEIQQHLVSFDSKDPCKYDFALFGLGAFEGFK